MGGVADIAVFSERICPNSQLLLLASFPSCAFGQKKQSIARYHLNTVFPILAQVSSSIGLQKKMQNWIIPWVAVIKRTVAPTEYLGMPYIRNTGTGVMVTIATIG